MSCKFCLFIFYLTDAPNINGLDSFFKRNDIVIVLMQPGQNYFETCFLFLGLFSHFFLTLITRKLHFVVICNLRTVSLFHFRPFKQKDWWKTFSCKSIKPHKLVGK